MRIGIFGGTFDPPHVGHLILAAEARDQLDLDCVLWVVTPDPPHKTTRALTPLETRLVMVHAAIDGDERFQISRIEIDRPGPHYSADTVRILAEEYPGSQLYYLMGGDSLRDLEAAAAAGAKPCLVLTGKGKKTREAGGLPPGTRVFADLAAFAAQLAP